MCLWCFFWSLAFLVGAFAGEATAGRPANELATAIIMASNLVFMVFSPWGALLRYDHSRILRLMRTEKSRLREPDTRLCGNRRRSRAGGQAFTRVLSGKQGQIRSDRDGGDGFE